MFCRLSFYSPEHLRQCRLCFLTYELQMRAAGILRYDGAEDMYVTSSTSQTSAPEHAVLTVLTRTDARLEVPCKVY